MKIGSGQVAGLLRNPVSVAGLLIYGEDWGLVRDRARAAVRAVLGDAIDPFRHSTLIREEHARLREVASGLALGGGRRVVHVQDAADALASTLEKLALEPRDILLVVEAGELTPRSKLRAFAEKHAAWGAVPCYASDAGRVGSEIESALQQAGLRVTADALAFLTEELAGESVTRRSELEKLVLFATGLPAVDIETAQACCSVSAEASLAAAVSAALAGRAETCDALLSELAREGATGAGLLAVLSNQVARLLKLRLLMDGGSSADEACRALTPPLYPRQAAVFMQELQRWRRPALEAVGRAIREADIACKRAASPDLAIAGRLLTAIASRGGA